MAVTNIGNTSDKIIISDNATPASGTYAWYLPATSAAFDWAGRFSEATQETSEGGINTGFKGLILNMNWSFRRIPIKGWTDYSNLFKALFSWDKNNTKLYLSFKPDGFGSNNVAVAATAAAPTTLTQFTGKTIGIRMYEFSDGICYADVNLPFINTP